MDREQAKDRLHKFVGNGLTEAFKTVDMIFDFHEQKYKALCDRYIALKLKSQSKEIDLTDLTVNDLLKLQDKVHSQLEERLK